MNEFYRAPLTSAEATATLAALHALRALCESQADALAVAGEFDPGVLQLAAEKLADELPEFMRERAVRLAETLTDAARTGASLLGEIEPENETGEPPFPVGRTRRLLNDAWDRRAPVEIEYFVAGRREWTNRRVDISDIQDNGNGWLLSGQCGLRHEYRHFRLDHIRAVRVLDALDDEDDADPFDSPEPLAPVTPPPTTRRRRSSRPKP